MKTRVFAVSLAVATVFVLFGLYIGLYLTAQPASAVAGPSPQGGVQLYLATVPTDETTDPHNTWVSYYQVNAKAQDWQHKTTFVLPAHTLVHITIYQYDGASGLRNPFISQPTGTLGGAIEDNGQSIQAISPGSTSHVFAIPAIGLSVPLQGVSANAKNPCANAPCSLSNAHNTISFTFRTPGKGVYRWQCFVPCAAGFVDGIGGPMATVGYMDGFVNVV